MGHVALCAVTLFFLGSCAAARTPSLAVDGYRRIAIPSGCYGHESDHNVQLTRALEEALLGLLQERGAGAKCWHEQKDGSLLLAIDDECGPHREVEFHRPAGDWAVKSERDVPIVICDERAR